jgi:hypothetical protein
MVKKNDVIKIYWAPSAFNDSEEQWNMIYSEPVPVADAFYSNLNEDAQIVRCPVTRDSMKNLYSLNSLIDDEFNLTPELMNAVYEDNSDGQYFIPFDSKISVRRPGKTSYKNYVNFSYNMSWFFFCDEPIVMKIMPPIFPVTTPVPNSILAFGEFDIGQWVRTLNLDYHVPIDAKKFSIKKNQPLAFLEFKTDKKIEFVRFKNTQLLLSLQKEFVESPSRWGRNMSLAKRYSMAKSSKILDLVSSEIKKNIV